MINHSIEAPCSFISISIEKLQEKAKLPLLDVIYSKKKLPIAKVPDKAVINEETIVGQTSLFLFQVINVWVFKPGEVSLVRICRGVN